MAAAGLVIIIIIALLLGENGYDKGMTGEDYKTMWKNFGWLVAIMIVAGIFVTILIGAQSLLMLTVLKVLK